MTITDNIEVRLKLSTHYVFLRSDFNDLGDYSKVTRALQQICKKNILLRIGHGVYTKIRLNRINNNLMFASPGGSDAVLLEVLNRLNIPYEFTGLTADYFAGKTTQIPALVEVKINKRFSRKIKVGQHKLNIY